jgi:hybrid cluster-associated redox disulfide protein
MFNPFKKEQPLTPSQKAVLGVKEEPSVPAEKPEPATQSPGQYVTKDMILGDIVERFPQAVFVMSQFGLHCVGCHANVFDTVEAGAKAHGMPDQEVDEMLAEVNKVIADSEKEAEAELNKMKVEEQK